MGEKRGFTLIELLVVIAIIALLMSILIPALAKVREQSRTIGCLGNLRQWGIVSTMYAEANSGKLWSGIGTTGWWWLFQLPDNLKDWKQNKTWFCPTATKLQVDENGVSAQVLNIFNAWGIYKDPYQGYTAPAQNEYAAWTDYDMARCCINRHMGYVGCTFADASCRKVALKELWTLQWSKSFNTRGPWTQAGGVDASAWPDWIRPLKDF